MATVPVTKSLIGLEDLSVGAGSFNAAGSDSTLLTLKQINAIRLGGLQVFNVQHEDYGAKGDAATIDTQGINAAIAAANASSVLTRGIVWFPAGKYPIDGDITPLESNVVCIGESMNSVQIQVLANLTRAVFTNAGGVNTSNIGCGVRDITVNGPAP